MIVKKLNVNVKKKLKILNYLDNHHDFVVLVIIKEYKYF